MLKGIGILVVGFCLVFLGGSTAYGVQVNPSVLEIEANAGEVKEGTFELTNWSGNTLHIEISVEEYRYLLGKDFIAPEGEEKYLPSAASWIEITPREMVINPRETKVVRYSITIPKGTKEEALAEIFFDRRPMKDGKLQSITTGEGDYKFNLIIISREAVPIYVKIKEGMKVAADIVDFAFERDWFTESTKISFLLQNKGNVHFRPKGKVTIKSKKGRKVASLNFPYMTKFPLFPKYGCEISTTFKKPLYPGDYTALVSVDIGAEEPIQKEKKFTVTKEGEIR